MARRVFRILLGVGLVAVAGLTGWQIWSLERTRTQQRADVESLQAVAIRSTQALLDIRASQRAYLSPGQGVPFWQARVDRQLAALREDLQQLKDRSFLTNGPAAQADDAALDALVDVTRLERRIVEHALAGRLQHAADLVYADNVRAGLTLERAIGDALAAHRRDLQAQHTRLRWHEGSLLGLSLAVGFLLAWVISPGKPAAAEGAAGQGQEREAGRAPGTPVRSRTRDRNPEPARDAGGRSTLGGWDGPLHAEGREAAASTTSTAAESRAKSRTAGAGVTPHPNPLPSKGRGNPAPPARLRGEGRDEGSHDDGPVERAGAGTGEAPVSASDIAATTASAMAAVANASEAGVLGQAADLCVAVARLGDATGLRPILGQLAHQLDAVGVIVWLEDTDGRTLTPSVTHGYASETLALLRPIDREADNATAHAFRLAEPQIVPGRGAAPGAIVVPMQTAAGCVGVIAAEVRHGREHDPATLALARIVAAQLALLTGPAPGSP